jgi:hypothetical protein
VKETYKSSVENYVKPTLSKVGEKTNKLGKWGPLVVTNYERTAGPFFPIFFFGKSEGFQVTSGLSLSPLSTLHEAAFSYKTVLFDVFFSDRSHFVCYSGGYYISN